METIHKEMTKMVVATPIIKPGKHVGISDVEKDEAVPDE